MMRFFNKNIIKGSFLKQINANSNYYDNGYHLQKQLKIEPVKLENCLFDEA